MLFIFEVMQMAIKIRKLTLLLITIIFLISSSFIIYWLEPSVFENPFIGLWYVMTTVTTTGYGDYVPQTVIGKVFGLFLYMFGIGLIGIVIGKIAESFGIYRKLREEGKLRFNGTGHYVIIGWSNKARHTMNEILEIDEHAKILLIDTLPKAPVDHEKVYYLQGDATDQQILEKANILHVSAVLIFTKDDNMDPAAADGKSLLTVSAIESYATEKEKGIYTIVEIIKEKHIPNFKHANVDEFVLADEALSDLMAKAAIHKGTGKFIMKLLSRKSGVDIWKIKKQPVWQTYNDAFENLKRVGAHLISDRDDFEILNKLEQPIPSDAELYIICNKQTYQKALQT